LAISGTLAHLLDVRREEVDHALQRHRHLAIGGGRADGERLEELLGRLDAHGKRNPLTGKPSVR
jgi:hypothetical protein